MDHAQGSETTFSDRRAEPGIMSGLLTRNQVGLMMLSLLSQESSRDLFVLLNRLCGSELKYATYGKAHQEQGLEATFHALRFNMFSQ